MENYLLIVLNYMMDNVIFVKNVKLNSSINCAAETVSYSMTDYKKQFEQVYKNNLHKVIFFANSYLNDIKEAENIAHDVFVVFWKNIDNIEQDKMVTYIFITTKHMCINVLRRRVISNKYTTYKSKVAYLNHIALENDSSINIFEKDMLTIFNKGLLLMKDKVRRTFLLSRAKGMKNREIADIEGVAESTIEARISNALLIMRKMFNDYIKYK